MSHVFHQLYCHFAWATHCREPLLDRPWRPQLLEIINDEVPGNPALNGWATGNRLNGAERFPHTGRTAF